MEEDLKQDRAPRRSLKKYELTNLLFILVLIVALGVLVTFVFRYYGRRGLESSGESTGVVSDAVGAGSDVGIFYLDTKLSETTLRCRNRLEISITDDGLVKELFALPGVEEVTIDQKVIMIKKYNSARWEGIQSGVRRIVKNHLHIHY